MSSVILDRLSVSNALTAVVAVLVVVVLKKMLDLISNRWRINSALEVFPSAPRHWLYGSLQKQNQTGTGQAFLDLHLQRVRENPRAYRIWFGPFFCNLLVVHPDTIKPVFRVSDPKNHIYHVTLKPWLGEGLLIAKGRKWARNRRLLTPAFHFEILRSYVDIFNDVTDVFMGRIEEYMEKEKPLDLFRRISLLTLDIILQCAFSYATDCQLEGNRHPYIDAVFGLSHIWSRRHMKFLTILFPPYYWLTADGKKFAQLCDTVHHEADKVIDARKHLLDEQGEEFLKTKKCLDFLDILLTAKDDQGNGMSRDEIRAEVDTFLFEGHDTTASGISWTLYLLAKHPEYQRQCQEEIDSLVAARGSDRLNWSSLSKLPVLTRCLKESMRMYPPVPMVGRQLSQELEIDGKKVPAGTTVNVPIWALHHNPTVWGEDHMEYKPSRFNEENMRKMDPYAYLPFSAGPRNCIGQTFAMSEEKTVLARLLHRYSFSIAEESAPVDLIVRVVLRSLEEVKLKVTRRE